MQYQLRDADQVNQCQRDRQAGKNADSWERRHQQVWAYDEIRAQGEKFRRQEWGTWGRGGKPGENDESVQSMLNLKQQMQLRKLG